MARRGRIKKTLPDLDPIYGNRLVTQLINRVMKHGKKNLARRLVYKAFETIKKRGEDPVKIFQQAIKNVGPQMEVRPRRIGGASYLVPVEVRGRRRTALAIRWIIEEANNRSNQEYHTFDAKLADELMDAAIKKGEAVRKRELSHRMAEANKAFAHFRW